MEIKLKEEVKEKPEFIEHTEPGSLWLCKNISSEKSHIILRYPIDYRYPDVIGIIIENERSWAIRKTTTYRLIREIKTLVEQ